MRFCSRNNAKGESNSKDLKQQKFQIEAEPTETIGAVKEKIKGEKGWEPSTQKLIYSGKILQDDNTIESYKIEEKGFIVCMTSKPKAAPKPVTGPSTPAQASSTPAAPAAPIAPPQGLAATATANPPATPTPAPTSAAPTATDSTTFNDPSALTMGDQRTAAIANMEAMGFPRDQIDQAMRAAFFNPDRAVQYLLEGIPENIQQEQAAAAQQRAAARAPAPASGNTAAPETAIPAPSADAAGDEPVNLFETAATQRSAAGAGTGAGAGAGAGARATGAPGAGQQAGTANLDFLRTNPQFVQLRQLVQQQPQMLEMILQQLSLNEPGHRATVDSRANIMIL